MQQCRFEIREILQRAWGPRGPLIFGKIRAFRNSEARTSSEGYALKLRPVDGPYIIAK
jgi:hypothetical protein